MIHYRCPDCGDSLDCYKIMKLFQNMWMYNGSTDECWCPLCFLKRQGFAPIHNEELFSNGEIVCMECGGTCGLDTLENLIKHYGNQQCELEEAATGGRFLAFEEEAAVNRGDRALLFVWGAAGRQPLRTLNREPIKLDPGEERCFCNNCELLHVRT